MITLTNLEKDIRRELIDFVKIGDNDNSFVRYKPLAEKFHIPFGNEHERNLLYEMIGNISKYEHSNGRPLLSVVVVTEDYIPGRGFFTLAKELGKQESNEDNDSFALKEREELFEFWKNNDDPDI